MRRRIARAAGTEELREHACELWNHTDGFGTASEPAHLAQKLVAGG